MNVTVVIKDANTSVFTMDDWEVNRLVEALDDQEIGFLCFEDNGYKMRINKAHIIKIWWKE